MKDSRLVHTDALGLYIVPLEKGIRYRIVCAEHDNMFQSLPMVTRQELQEFAKLIENLDDPA